MTLALAKAKELALDALVASSGRECGAFAFLDEHALRKPYGWVLVYESRRYVETGDVLEAFGGNGPVVVMDDGSVHMLGSALAVEDSVAAFERARGM